MNQPANAYPLLLCVPGLQGLPVEEHRLPLGEADYEVRRSDDIWQVVVRSTGELIYAGPGPVRIRRSPAPF
jgi:hypothetical protein